MTNMNIVFSKTEPDKNKIWYDGDTLKVFKGNTGWEDIYSNVIGDLSSIIDNINGEDFEDE